VTPRGTFSLEAKNSKGKNRILSTKEKDEMAGARRDMELF
jgi:hypothetical protein